MAISVGRVALQRVLLLKPWQSSSQRVYRQRRSTTAFKPSLYFSLNVPADLVSYHLSVKGVSRIYVPDSRELCCRQPCLLLAPTTPRAHLHVQRRPTAHKQADGLNGDRGTNTLSKANPNNKPQRASAWSANSVTHVKKTATLSPD